LEKVQPKFSSYLNWKREIRYPKIYLKLVQLVEALEWDEIEVSRFLSKPKHIHDLDLHKDFDG